MKKSISIFFLFLTNFAIAQTYSLAIDTLSVTVPFIDVQSDQFYTLSDLNHLTNNTSLSVASTWHRDIQYLTTGWTTYVCDPSLCHSETTDSADFIFLADTTAIVYVDFKPNQLEGYGVVKIVFSKIGSPQDSVAGIFIGIVDAGNGISSIEKLKDIKLFPNPANDNLIIVTTSELTPATVEVYNMLGKGMNSNVKKENENIFSIDVKSLNNGFYFIKMNLKDGTTLTRGFSKN